MSDLLCIVELGGYPDFRSLYQQCGYSVHVENSMRKATKYLKKTTPKVIVTEFNFQSDFRDRTSQLETLMASLQQKEKVQLVVFYDLEQAHQLQRVQDRFELDCCLAYPIDAAALEIFLLSLKDKGAALS